VVFRNSAQIGLPEGSMMDDINRPEANRGLINFLQSPITFFEIAILWHPLIVCGAGSFKQCLGVNWVPALSMKKT
jgi:hypothetical protein